MAHLDKCRALRYGYQSRRARLDALKAPPQLPAEPLPTINWTSISDAATLEVCRAYLDEQWKLLDQCLAAWEAHDDYGGMKIGWPVEKAKMGEMEVLRDILGWVLRKLDEQVEVVENGEGWWGKAPFLGDKQARQWEKSQWRENEEEMRSVSTGEMGVQAAGGDAVEEVMEERRRKCVALLRVLLRRPIGAPAEEAKPVENLFTLWRDSNGPLLGYPGAHIVARQISELCTPRRAPTKVELANMQRQAQAVREFLLIRLMAKHTHLTGTARKCKSLDEFFDSARIRTPDLRALALAFAQPGNGDWLDACADQYIAEMEPENADLVDCERVQICGRWLYNYTGSSAARRNSWLLFPQLITTNTTLAAAIGLCRTWPEFSSLITLATTGQLLGCGRSWRLPPLCNEYRAQTLVQRLQRNGLVGYYCKPALGPAMIAKVTKHTHAAVETRNLIAGLLGRSEEGTRRFLALADTWRHRIVLWARDGRTGEMLYQPPEDECWLMRSLAPGASAWKVMSAFDESMKAKIEDSRPWKFVADDCVDVVLWSRSDSGIDLAAFLGEVEGVLATALRVHSWLAALAPTVDVLGRDAAHESGATCARAQLAASINTRLAVLHTVEPFPRPLPDYVVATPPPGPSPFWATVATEAAAAVAMAETIAATKPAANPLEARLFATMATVQLLCASHPFRAAAKKSQFPNLLDNTRRAAEAPVHAACVLRWGDTVIKPALLQDPVQDLAGLDGTIAPSWTLPSALASPSTIPPLPAPLPETTFTSTLSFTALPDRPRAYAFTDAQGRIWDWTLPVLSPPSEEERAWMRVWMNEVTVGARTREECLQLTVFAVMKYSREACVEWGLGFVGVAKE
ncbi:hypothetical protein EDC01DRAFT_784720 [Geopyxis carbonaria]|nr:hypothetical protein EDC01DRAFT_784720 [Geopyxis carbonaria]